MGKFSEEIEVSGHLIDSMILTKIFDKIMDLKGEFQVQEISIGKKKKDQSYDRLLIDAKNQEHLDMSSLNFHKRLQSPVYHSLFLNN